MTNHTFSKFGVFKSKVTRKLALQNNSCGGRTQNISENKDLKNLKVLATEIYKISRGISLRFMQDLVEVFDTKYQTRSRYGVELDKDGNVKSLNKKLNYRPHESFKSAFGLESYR